MNGYNAVIPIKTVISSLKKFFDFQIKYNYVLKYNEIKFLLMKHAGHLHFKKNIFLVTTRF